MEKCFKNRERKSSRTSSPSGRPQTLLRRPLCSSLDIPFNCVSLLCRLSISAYGHLAACTTLYFCVAYSFIYLSVSLHVSSLRPSIYPRRALQFNSSSNYYSQSIIERFDLRRFRRPSLLLLHLGSYDASNGIRKIDIFILKES